MSDAKNPVGWFEIPATDINRAKQFYESMLNIEMQLVDLGDLKMCWFPSSMASYGSSGALVQQTDNYKPSADGGVVIYLSCDDVNISLNKAKEMNASIIQDKKQISPEHGFMGLLIDSEGNRIALHSNQ